MQIDGNQTLGLWFGKRVNSLWSWLITLTIIAGSVRGAIVLNLDISSEAVYATTAGALLLLATWGLLISRGVDSQEVAMLKKLLLVNVLFFGINIVIDLLLGIPFSPVLLYSFLGPYVVFLLMRVPTFHLNVVVGMISIAISYSVCDNFYDLLQGAEGYEKVFAYNLKLRPDVFEGFSNTAGIAYRVGGYTANYHDAANILGMTATFFFVRFLLKRTMLDFGLCLFALLSLTLTQSAANIVVAIFTIVVFSGYIFLRDLKIATLIYIFLGLSGVLALGAIFGDEMTIFLARIGPDGDWEGMLRTLDIYSFFTATPFILFGHATGFESDVAHTEIGLLKSIYQLGIVHATIFCMILLYPVLRFIKIRSLCADALPSVAAIFFGFMSLLHYWSLYRVTSIFLFFVFHAIALNNIVCCRDYLRNSRSLVREPVAVKIS